MEMRVMGGEWWYFLNVPVERSVAELRRWAAGNEGYEFRLRGGGKVYGREVEVIREAKGKVGGPRRKWDAETWREREARLTRGGGM